MCRKAKRQDVDEEWQRTSSMLPIMNVEYHRGREVGEGGLMIVCEEQSSGVNRGGSGGQTTFSCCALRDFYCAASYEHFLNLCLH
jgi:hypothetical protein